jgi:hypothetical protein
MRKVILVPALLCAVAVVAGAQTKISDKLTCAKPSVRQMAGDGSQSIMFTKSSCTWATPFVIGGNKANETVDAAIADMSGSTAKNHGYSTMVMDNGDSTFVRYEGTMQMKKDGSGTYKGTWKYVRGTGKFRGIKGSGTYKGAGATDGTGWADVTGHYSLAKGK